MNKKGMTLVEIILVVALLGLLAILISTNAISMLNKERDKKITEAQNRILEACKTYCSLSANKENNQCKGTKPLSVELLYTDGLITEDDYNNSKKKNSSITVKIENAELTCNFN